MLLVFSGSVHAQDKVVVVPLGGNDGPFAKAYYVTVDFDGSIISKTPGVVSAGKGGTGQYVIEFDEDDVANCFAIGTLANTTQGGSLTGSVGITQSVAAASDLFIRVIDPNGYNGPLNKDAPFTIQLVCPPNIMFPPEEKSVNKNPSHPLGNIINE